MSEFTFNLSFIGIFAIVTGPIDQRDGGFDATLIAMPNCGGHGDAHRPILAIEPKFVAAASAPATAATAFPFLDNYRALKPLLLWDLTGARVRIMPDGFATSAKGTQTLLNIPDVEYLHPGARFKASSIAGMGSGGVCGSAVLVEGGDLTSRPPSDPREYVFTTRNGARASAPQTLTDGVDLVIPGVRASVVIELHSRDGVRSIHLPVRGDAIRAIVTNLPLQVEARRPDPDTMPLPPETLPHFLLHYDLLDNPPEPDQRLVPVQVQAKHEEGRAEGEPVLEDPQCKPPARMMSDVPVLQIWSAAGEHSVSSAESSGTHRPHHS
jgi:hypothetical protein